MSKKALSIIMLVGIVLSACGEQATEQATETPTAIPATTAPPTLPPTNTPTEEVIPVTGESPTPLPTATEFVPNNPTDCINKATFVSDVTIPDNSNVAAGASFLKTWRVQNAGTCTWWSGYTLTHYSQEAMSAPASVSLPVTNPGQTADVSIDLVAPNVAGKYQGNFVIKNPAGLIMQVDNDSRLWVIINVSGTAAGTPAATTASGGDSTAATAGSTSGAGNATCAFTTDAARSEQVAAAINSYRAQNGLASYTVNAQLSQAAQRHANDMACNNLFYHNGSDGSTPQSRVAATGYSASKVTENVYGSYPPLTPEGAVTWWKLDQTDINHNKNLISTDYIEIGVGYSFFNNYGYYVVVFAKP